MENSIDLFLLVLLFIPFSLFLFVIRWNRISGIENLNNKYSKMFFDLGCFLMKEKELSLKKSERSFNETNLGSPYSLFHD